MSECITAIPAASDFLFNTSVHCFGEVLARPEHAHATMTAPDLPESLLGFLQSTIPTFSAAELLIFLARHTGPWTVKEIVRAIEPAVISAAAVEEYLALFKANGLVTVAGDAAIRYAPSSAECAAAVALLEQAYNERPVTLIRTISTLADSRIRSFADSFKIKGDRP